MRPPSIANERLAASPMTFSAGFSKARPRALMAYLLGNEKTSLDELEQIQKLIEQHRQQGAQP